MLSFTDAKRYVLNNHHPKAKEMVRNFGNLREQHLSSMKKELW
jgi:hypothetical protein